MRQSPYKHADGSGCWTKGCKIGNSSTLFSVEDSTVASFLIPRDFDESHARYYAQTDAKHFAGQDSPGSQFTDPRVNSLNDLVALKVHQSGVTKFRGGEDDREELIARGSHPDGFKEGNSYYMVKTPGVVGVVSSETLSDDSMVDVVRTKEGASCSLVVSVRNKPDIDYGVVIVSTHKETGNPFVVTAFPGPVTGTISSEEIDSHEGQSLSVSEVKRILEVDSFWCNARLSNA